MTSRSPCPVLLPIILITLLAAPARSAPPVRPADQNARSAPQWLSRGIIYQIWLRSFTPEGTLKAAAQKLPHIADLGATIVYLPPVMLADDDTRLEFWSPRQRQSIAKNARNPYRMKDFDKIDPEYGSEADLREFVAAAHQLKLRVLLDLVFHHSGPTCTLTANPDFYQRDASGKFLTNSWNFLRLNFKNRELREYFIANMARWAKDFDIDGFRCDVSAAVPLDFWEEARERLASIRPDLVMLAENATLPAEQLKAFELSYTFPWYNRCVEVVSQGKPATLLREEWQKRHDTYPRGARFIRYADNHDLQRADVVFGERGAQALSVLHFTLDGVPYLYNGQEIGDATPCDLFSHWPIRWEAAGLPNQAKKLEFYKKLCAMRRDHPALSEGELLWLENDQPQSVLTFLRRGAGQQMLSVINLSNTTLKVQVKMPEGSPSGWNNLLTPAPAQATPGTVTVGLDGFDYFVAKQ